MFVVIVFNNADKVHQIYLAKTLNGAQLLATGLNASGWKTLVQKPTEV